MNLTRLAIRSLWGFLLVDATKEAATAGKSGPATEHQESWHYALGSENRRGESGST